MFLNEAPGEEVHGLTVAGFYVEMLDDAVFNFVGVGEGGVAVETDELGKIVDAGDVPVGGEGLDRVFIAMVGERPIEETFESGRAKLQREFAGIAGDGFAGEGGLGVEGIVGIGGGEGGGG